MTNELVALSRSRIQKLAPPESRLFDTHGATMRGGDGVHEDEPEPDAGRPRYGGGGAAGAHFDIHDLVLLHAGARSSAYLPMMAPVPSACQRTVTAPPFGV